MNLNICCSSCGCGGIQGDINDPNVYNCIHFTYSAKSYNSKCLPCIGDKLRFRATALCRKCDKKFVIVDDKCSKVGKLMLYVTCSKCLSAYV